MSETTFRRGRSGPNASGDNPSFGAPTVAIPDETITAYLNSSRFMAVLRKRIGNNWKREQVGGPSGHISVPLDGVWRGVSTLTGAIGGKLRITPRWSGIIGARYTTSWYTPNSSQTMRGTFRFGSRRVSPENQPGGDPANGLVYAQDSGTPSGQWVPASLEFMDRFPIGETIEIEPEFIGNGGGTGFLLGTSAHSYLYVWEAF